MFGLGRSKITERERKEEFCGVEGMPHVEHAEPGQFPQYIPTDMKNVKNDTEISLLNITQAKFKLGMYPIQRKLSQLLGRNDRNIE